MKSFKKLTALLLTLLLTVGVFAVGGMGSSAAPRQFFAAKDEAGNYAKYRAALDILGSEYDPNSLISKYYYYTRRANMVALKAEQIAEKEEAVTELAKIKDEAERNIAILTVNAGDTFVGNSWFEYTGPTDDDVRKNRAKAGFDTDSVAWVNVKFMPGTLQNLTYSYKYNNPKKETPEDTWADPEQPEYELNPDSEWYCLSTYSAASAETVIDLENTVFAGVPEDNSHYIAPGTTLAFDYYALGCFGYMTGSHRLADIADNTVLTIPAVGGKALGFKLGASPLYYSDTSTSAPYKNNSVGSYPLIPEVWTMAKFGLATNWTYIYNSDVYRLADGTYSVQSADNSPLPTSYGALDDTDVLEKLIPIDFVCEYDAVINGVKGKAQAVFDCWRIVAINNNPEKRILWDGDVSPYSGYSAGEPYNNYEITLEAQWKTADGKPFPVYEQKAPFRTWNWLLERIMRWALNIGDLDEFGDPIPYAGSLLTGLMTWLLAFVTWIGEITNVNIADILATFGLDLGGLF